MANKDTEREREVIITNDEYISSKCCFHFCLLTLIIIVHIILSTSFLAINIFLVLQIHNTTMAPAAYNSVVTKQLHH